VPATAERAFLTLLSELESWSTNNGQSSTP
jgi:hypothetical protein